MSTNNLRQTAVQENGSQSTPAAPAPNSFSISRLCGVPSIASSTMCRSNRFIITCANYPSQCSGCSLDNCKYKPYDLYKPAQTTPAIPERKLTRRIQLNLVFKDDENKGHIIEKTQMLLVKNEIQPYGISTGQIDRLNRILYTINPQLQLYCIYNDMYEVPYSSYEEYVKFECGLIEAYVEKILVSAAKQFGNPNADYVELYNTKFDTELIDETIVFGGSAEKQNPEESYCSKVNMDKTLTDFLIQYDFQPFTFNDFKTYCSRTIKDPEWLSQIEINVSKFLTLCMTNGNLIKDFGKKPTDPIMYICTKTKK